MDTLYSPKESYESDTKSIRERMRGIQVFSFLRTCICARQVATLLLMRFLMRFLTKDHMQQDQIKAYGRGLAYACQQANK